ncbi:MFS transporter [Paenibacillus sp. F411]|uniref:staphylopine family metallophore export MFS transporter CntE n=1 Tax=Paenibacillus sp. F411 TaxID=2820239 RepID=UPI001AAF0345|nr:MFS transporter [Paenibacillus sp. F411]MBO2942876.1 MFS transporter [Paenibacillus sp. F411]
MTGALAWPFMRLYLLTLLYFSANAVLNVMIPLQGNALGASNTAIGIIMGAYLFTTMLFRPWAGRLIQKYGPVTILRSILIINGAALILYTISGLEGYFVARMLQGAVTAFFSMALQIAIMDALPEKDRGQGISMYSLCSYIPGILGPLLALGLWQTGSMSGFAFVMIGIAVFTGWVGFTVVIKEEPVEDKEQSSAKKTSIGASFKQVFLNRDLLRCSIIMLVASMIFGAVTTFIPLYAQEVKHGEAWLYLMLQAAVVVASRFTLRKKIPSDGRWHASYVAWVLLLLTLAAVCTGAASSLGAAVFYAGALLMGVSQAMIYPSLTTYLTFVLPAEQRNVLIGWFIASADLGVSMGSVLMGPLADLFSYGVMYGVCAVLGGSLILFAFGAPHRERNPQQPV